MICNSVFAAARESEMQYALLQLGECSYTNFVLQTGIHKENTPSAPIILILLLKGFGFVRERAGTRLESGTVHIMKLNLLKVYDDPSSSQVTGHFLVYDKYSLSYIFRCSLHGL